MFCYQRSFGNPTEVITAEQFRALITAPETFRKVKVAREALARGDKNAYDNKKKGLPFVIFIATYEEWDKKFEDKKTHEITIKRGCWRSQQHCRLNGLCVIDFDDRLTIDPDDAKGNRAKERRHRGRIAVDLVIELRRHSFKERWNNPKENDKREDDDGDDVFLADRRQISFKGRDIEVLKLIDFWSSKKEEDADHRGEEE